MKNCCLESRYDHTKIDKPHTQVFYRVGKLFEGRSICLWCLLHLQDLVRPALTESDVYHQIELTQRFPELWAVVQAVGIDVMRRELSMQWVECEPSSLPTRPEQTNEWPTLKVNVDGARGGQYK